MSNERKDGGPAFPTYVAANSNAKSGMTLRDHFAGLAMQGMATSFGWQGGPFDKVARDAYGMADAMLKVREQ